MRSRGRLPGLSGDPGALDGSRFLRSPPLPPTTFPRAHAQTRNPAPTPGPSLLDPSPLGQPPSRRGGQIGLGAIAPRWIAAGPLRRRAGAGLAEHPRPQGARRRRGSPSLAARPPCPSPAGPEPVSSSSAPVPTLRTVDSRTYGPPSPPSLLQSRLSRDWNLDWNWGPGHQTKELGSKVLVFGGESG